MNPGNGRGVTFDLWETLIFDDPEKDEARGQMRCEGIRAVLSDHNIPIAMTNLMEAYEQSAPRLQTVWNRNDEVSIIDQIRMIVRLATGSSLSAELEWASFLEEAYVKPILTIPPSLNTDATEVLRAMRDRGYKIGLISNTGRSPGSALRRLLDSYGVLHFFDATVFSNEVMRRKPDRVIFDEAAHSLGVDKGHIVHIGDNPNTDFWGARNAGMQAILLDQTPPAATQWRPLSLFALSRAGQEESLLRIEQRCRIRSLDMAVELMDTMFLS